MMETRTLPNADCELRGTTSAIARLWAMNLFATFPAMATFSSLFLVTILLCCQARAQTRPDGPSNDQKSQGRLVPDSEELLKKAMKNAKAVAPDDARPRVPVQVVETKLPQNPGQQKLLPDNSSLPDTTRSNAQKQPSGSKEPASKPELTDPGADRDTPSGNSEKAGDQVDGSVWEPTAISVNRVFLATDGANGEARKIPMSVPVLYESRLMGLDKDKQRAIARLLDKLVNYRARLAAMRKEGTDLLAEWNQILGSSTPQDLLLSDSPSLIEKESSDTAAAPGFEPGKGVSVLVKSTTPRQ
ncbi:MAG TPA: hypothetical protein VFO40_06180 [Chthoniobacterales bacterium]|nr:hypothetical protein [Chthoniobacterales bacterium]